MKVWQCSVCKYIHRGETPPEKCPVCGVDKSKFIEINESDIPEKKSPKSPSTVKKKGKEAAKQPAAAPQVTAPSPDLTGFEKIQSLLIKHHAHPVSVHTPNGILPAAVVLWLLAWIFNSDLLSKVACVNIIFVVISLPFVIFTGVLEWKKKYNGALTLIFKFKIMAAAITSTTCIISLIWYLADPEILSGPKAWVFILINILMLAAAGIAGYIGGKLVFKD